MDIDFVAIMTIMVQVLRKSGMSFFILLLILYVPMLWSGGCEDDKSSQTDPVELAPAEPIPMVDLTWQREEIPEEENAYPIWQKAVEAYVEISDPNILRNVEGYTYWETPTDKQLQKYKIWVGKNAITIREFNKGMRKKNCQFPKLPVAAEITEEMMIYLRGLKKLSNLKYVQAMLLALDKQYSLATKEILKTIRFGEKVLSGDGYILHMAIGSDIQKRGFRALYWLMGQEDVPSQTLLAVEAELGKYTSARRDLAQCYLAEHDHIKQGFESKEFQQLVQEAYEISPEYQLDRDYLLAFLKNYFSFAIHKITGSWDAKMLFENTAPGRILSQFNKELEKDYTGLIQMDDYEKGVKTLERSLKKEKHFMELFMLELCFVPAFEAGYISSFKKDAERAIVRVILLVEAYRKNHSQLPESLQEILEEGVVTDLPLDPFTDEPIFYDRKRKIVWSAGPDRINHKGLEGEIQSDPKDIVWKLPGFERVNKNEGDTYRGYGLGNYYVPGIRSENKWDNMRRGKEDN